MRGGKLRKPEEITVGELDMHLASFFFFYFLYVISNYIINITINTISHITPRISPRAFGSRADIGVSG